MSGIKSGVPGTAPGKPALTTEVITEARALTVEVEARLTTSTAGMQEWVDRAWAVLREVAKCKTS
jgi:hypothetical protein